VLSFLRTLTTWHYPHSPDARRAPVRRAAIDRYLLLANDSSKPAAGLLLWVHGGTDRQTGGQTDVTDGQVDRRPMIVQTHGLCSAYYAGIANNNSLGRSSYL